MTLKTIDDARDAASNNLRLDGWNWDRETAKWVHPDGRRGRLCFVQSADPGDGIHVYERVDLQPENGDRFEVVRFT